MNSFPVYNSIQYCHETVEINILLSCECLFVFARLITLLYMKSEATWQFLWPSLVVARRLMDRNPFRRVNLLEVEVQCLWNYSVGFGMASPCWLPHSNHWHSHHGKFARDADLYVQMGQSEGRKEGYSRLWPINKCWAALPSIKAAANSHRGSDCIGIVM